jgi:hypothetical protein
LEGYVPEFGVLCDFLGTPEENHKETKFKYISYSLSRKIFLTKIIFVTTCECRSCVKFLDIRNNERDLEN